MKRLTDLNFPAEEKRTYICSFQSKKKLLLIISRVKTHNHIETIEIVLEKNSVIHVLYLSFTFSFPTEKR